MIKRKFHDIWNFQVNGRQLYFIAFVLYFICAYIQDTTLSESLNGHVLRLVSYISLPLLLFKIYILDNWDKKDILIISVLIILGIVTWRKAQDMQLLLIVPLVVGAKGVNFKDIIYWYIYLSVILMISMALFSLLDIIPNLVYRAAPRPPRYSLGMIYTSSLATHYLYIVLAYCYAKFGKLGWLDYFLIIFGDVIIMLVTNTKLDFIATLFVVPIMFIAQRAFKGYKWSRIFASFWWMAVPILATIMIFSSYFYDSSNHIMKKINALTSGRLDLGYRAFSNYNVKLLGQTIVEHTYGGSKGLKLANEINSYNHYFFIDSSYLRMLILWGLIASMLILVSMTYIAIRSTVNKIFILSAIILIASLNFMFEPDIIKVFYDPFLLALLSTPTFYNARRKNL